MKKRIVSLVLSAVLLLGMCMPTLASEDDGIMPCWSNIVLVDGCIGFDGTSGNYSLEIVGMPGVSRITATATLYYTNVRGNWMKSTTWTYDEYADELNIDEDFTGISGRDYKVELSATVYLNGYGEPLTRTDKATCD